MTTARAFRGYRFPAEVILWAVRWYLQFPISYRDLERMLADRGVEVDHTTMYRWVQRFAPELEKRTRRHLRPCRGPWHVDETYLRVDGEFGIDLDRSTLADWVGKSTALLEPLADAIGRHVLGGPAIFADDTPNKLQAPGTGKTRTARIWAYVRDERPWLGPGPPAACYRFTVDRKSEHPASHLQGYQGWMHADGYSGFNEIFRSGGVRKVACMAHIRRKFVDVFQAEGSLIAEETIKRIAGLYAVEKEGRGRSPDERVRLRQVHARPILDDLESWLQAQLPRISGKSELAKAIRYALARMRKLRPYLDHGSLEADNNGAERALKPVALGRKNFLFVGSAGGGKSAAIAYTLIETAKLNGINPQAWLTDVLGRIADHKITRIHELLPWRYAAAAA